MLFCSNALPERTGLNNYTRKKLILFRSSSNGINLAIFQIDKSIPTDNFFRYQ